MAETKRNNKLKKYHDLYQTSQWKIENEQLISESLLSSIIKGLKSAKVGFFAENIVSNYYNTSTRKRWGKIFFDKVEEYFFDDVKWQYIGILSLGYDTYGFKIDFKLNGIKYELVIPNPNNITINNIIFLYLGQYCLNKETRPGYYEFVAKSYDEDDIKAAIKEESEKER